MNAVIVQPEAKRGTIRTKTSAPTLDFFMVSTGLSTGVSDLAGSQPVRQREKRWIGCVLSAKRNHGREPMMRWASIIPEKKPAQKQPFVATTHWMKDVVGELSRIVMNWRKIGRARETLRDEDEEVNERKEEDFMQAITE